MNKMIVFVSMCVLIGLGSVEDFTFAHLFLGIGAFLSMAVAMPSVEQYSNSDV